MASFVYNQAAVRLWQTTPHDDWLADTLKLGLSSSTHVPNKDNDFLDEGGADDFIDGELSGTGYVAGFGNSGRKTLASKTITVDDANDRAEFDCADITWTAINAGTAAQATLLREITNDAASIPLANIDSGGFPKTTNGGDLNFQVNAEGLVHLTT